MKGRNVETRGKGKWKRGKKMWLMGRGMGMRMSRVEECVTSCM